MRWSVVVPVKRLDLAKSRLALASEHRQQLALAMALDVVATGIACPVVARVVVVSDDELARAEIGRLGAMLVADEPDAGLNPALTHGIGVARSASPADGIAVVSSDVPSVDADGLALVLADAAQHDRSYVSDRDGTGTTALLARPGVDVRPLFGTGSGAAHAAAGHVRLATGPQWRDVDTLEDLHAALAAAAPGAAPRTRAAVAQLGLGGG